MNYSKKPISTLLRSPRTVFTFKDICLLWGATERASAIAAVNYYVKTGALYRIRRGIYSKDRHYDKLELATRIFTPSYISFETVLTQAGINFQFYEKIMVASYQTRELMVDSQLFAYKKMKDRLLTNAAGIMHHNEYSVASPERAFLDTIYIHLDYHFDNLNALDWDAVFAILPIYKNKRMVRTVEKFFASFK